MANLTLQTFGGLKPRIGKYLLGNADATIAENCQLRSGELRGLNRPLKLVISGTANTQRIFRIKDSNDVDLWVEFTDRFAHFLKGPVVNDAFNRYYWTDSENMPQYNTLKRIEASAAAYTLGIPAATIANAYTGSTDYDIGRFAVEPSDTTLIYSNEPGNVVTRAYVYTFVSLYGEEGPPSNPVVISLPESNSWVIPMVTYTIPEKAIVSKRIYRTITDTSGSADYFFVAEVPVTQASYTDTSNTSTISLNNLLPSTTWSPPPAGLQGIVSHPNGFLVGYDGKDIWFSEPYRPHAWPINYVVSTSFDIVGLGIFENSIAVATKGNPYIVEGSHPAVTTLNKLEPAEPCRSHFGVVPILDGVLYPSTTGLIFVNNQGVRSVTKDLFTKDEWAEFDIDNIVAAEEDEQYIAFDSVRTGFIFSPAEADALLIKLSGAVWNTEMIQDDPLTGEVLIVNNDVIYQWNPANGIPMEYTWRSKKFGTPKPVNFGAAKISFFSDLTVTQENLQEFQDYNTLRFAAGPLQTINMCPINSAGDTTVSGSNLEPMKCPIGGSPLFNVSYFQTLVARITFNLYADRDQRNAQSIEEQQMANRTVQDEELIRLPTGYKAKDYSFEFIGNADLQSFKIAETSKELQRI